MMNDDTMLTTIDNPYNPFEDFTSWFLYDNEMGYNTCGRLGRIVHMEDNMTEKEMNDEIDRAIEHIIDTDFLGIYIKAYNPKLTPT